MVLMHGDQDVIVPSNEIMESALKQAHVETTFNRVPDGKHGPNFQFPAGDPRLPDHMGEAVRWFDGHLKGSLS
jgi:acetyl esterase/lipase